MKEVLNYSKHVIGGLKAENEMLGEANLRLKKQVEELTEALTESRNNDRIAMSWISDFLKAANFNGSYPEFVEWIEARHRGE